MNMNAPVPLIAARAGWASVAIFAVAVVAGCSSAGRPASPEGAVVVYEGLPHQMFESRLLERELATKETVKWGGFAFYAAPIAPSAGDAERLARLLAAETTCRPYRGPKLCGGFHPDWLLETGGADGATRALLCFGCSEVEFLGARTGRFDLDESAEAQLRAVLTPYRKNRPASKQ